MVSEEKHGKKKATIQGGGNDSFASLDAKKQKAPPIGGGGEV